MAVIESHTCSLVGSEEQFEDRFGATGSLAWVVDGATGILGDLGLSDTTDAAWYADNLSQHLAENGHLGPEDALRAALNSINQLAQDLVGESRARFPSAAVSVVSLQPDHTDVVALADCHVVVETTDGRYVHVGPDRSSDEDVPIECAIQRRWIRNTSGGLWVARRESEAVDHARKTVLPPARRVLLTTDGAWRAVDLGLVQGPAGIFEACVTPGSAGTMLERLREMEAAESGRWDDALVAMVARS